MSEAIQADFSRIQFTPDLLPADLIGTQIYNPRSGEFPIHQGPLFANLILADEISRAPAKVQSALLEAMQERQYDWQHDLPHEETVPGVGYPEPHRAGRDLSINTDQDYVKALTLFFQKRARRLRR